MSSEKPSDGPGGPAAEDGDAAGQVAGPVARRRFVQGMGVVAAAAGVSGAAGVYGPAAAKAPGPRKPGRGRRVAVLGGGPGGLSAAHELAERGFQVDLYERHAVLGGKCRSFGVPGTGRGGRADLPAEIGPHGFIGAYQNLGETMLRIPIGGGRTVLDNLTTGTDACGKGGWDGAAAKIPFSRNTNLPGRFTPAEVLKTITGALGIFGKLAPQDLAILGSKFLVLATTGQRRRWGQFENLPLSDFMHADRLSPNGKHLLNVLLQGAPIRAERQNTRVLVVGGGLNIGIDPIVRGRFGPGFTEYFAFTDGPMNEAFFDPWAAYLRSLGVRIHTGHTVTGLSSEGGRVTGAKIRKPNGTAATVEADWYVLAVPADKAAALMNRRLVAADPALGRIARLEQTWLGCMQIYLKKATGLESAGGGLGQPWMPAYLNAANRIWNRDFAAQYGDGTVVEAVSADIAAWDVPGILFGKTAKQCTGAEIFAEVRAQLRRDLGDNTLLPDSDIHSWVLNPALSRKGSRPIVHDEPGFANTPGSWKNQPEAVTKIPNLFLAASYVRTTTGVDAMDGANEAGKKAANGILHAAGATGRPAPIASAAPPKGLKSYWEDDDRRYQRGLPNAFDIIVPTRP